MSKQKDEQTKDPKPYVRYNCQGRYMEPGTEWEKTPWLCSGECDVRHTCWSMKNGPKTEDSGTQSSATEPPAPQADPGHTDERPDN